MSRWGRTPPTRPGWYWCWDSAAEAPCPLRYDGKAWWCSSGLRVPTLYMSKGVRFGPEIKRPEEA